MSCEETLPELLAFHFGEAREPSRSRVEAHLEVCPKCLRSYLSLKRAVELAELEPEPSAAFHARLRSAVAQELGLGAPRWQWWERPVAIGFAAAALAAAMLTMHVAATAPGAPPLGAPTPPQLERSRPSE
jgi:anti-sigma factor RsiW